MALIETLIYSVLAVIIFAAILQSTVNIASNCQRIDAKFTQQQAQLIINHYLKRDIHNAGFAACGLQRDPNFKRTLRCNPYTYECQQQLSPSIIRLINNASLHPRAAILVLHNVAAELNWLTQGMQNLSDSLHDDDTMQICDYTHSEEFSWRSSPAIALQHQYPPGTLVYRNSTIVYYLKKSVQVGDTPRFALYRDDAQRQAIALMENLTDMQINITPQQKQAVLQLEFSFVNGAQTTLTFSTRNGN